MRLSRAGRWAAGVLRTNLGAALFFALASFALLWQALIGTHVLLPSSVLYFLPPWTPQRPADIASFHNPVLSDVPTVYYPWWDYARENLRSGVVPQWNPYALGGAPFYANAQSALFSPFSLPLWLLPLKYGFGLAAAFRLWAASFGTFLFCRQLGFSYAPSLLGGLAFGFSAFSVLWLSYPVLSVLALLPWALWLVERIVVRRSSADGLALALVLALALLGGHPGSQVHLYAIVVVYAVLRLALTPATNRDRLSRLALVGLASALGLALAAFVLIPVAIAVRGTVGVEVRSGGSLAIPWEAARTLFFPDWWGRPTGVFYGGPFNYNERTVYAGTVAFLLATVSLTAIGRWRRVVPFALLAFLGFEAAFGLEPLGSILAKTPVLAHDRNARLSVLIQFGIAILAALGLDQVLRGGIARRTMILPGVVALTVAVVGLVGTHGSVNDVRTALHHFRTGEDFAQANVIELVSVGWWTIIAAGLLLALLLGRRLGAIRLTVVVLALLVIDEAHFARGYNPLTPVADALPSAPPSTKFLQQHVQRGRVAGIGVTLPPDTSLVYRLRDLRGNDPPGPEKPFMRIFRLVNPQQPVGDWLAVERLTPQGRRFLNLFDVRFVVAPSQSEGLGQPDFPFAYRGTDADVYLNEEARGRVFVPRQVIARRTAADVFATVRSRSFRPTEEAVVESDVPVAAGIGRASITSETPERVDVEARFTRRGLLVLADTYDEGWKVSIDDAPAHQVRIDGVVRGVVVPQGEHEVRWQYLTPGLVLGAAISSGTGVLTIAWGLLVLAKRRGYWRPSRLPRDQDETRSHDGDSKTA